MGAMFGGGKKETGEQRAAREAQLRAQRRQDQSIQAQTAEEAKDLGTRRRLANARGAGRNSLFAQTGAAGVQDTLG